MCSRPLFRNNIKETSLIPKVCSELFEALKVQPNEDKHTQQQFLPQSHCHPKFTHALTRTCMHTDWLKVH